MFVLYLLRLNRLVNKLVSLDPNIIKVYGDIVKALMNIYNRSYEQIRQQVRIFVVVVAAVVVFGSYVCLSSILMEIQETFALASSRPSCHPVFSASCDLSPRYSSARLFAPARPSFRFL